MPRKILATVVEVYCPNCGKNINLRAEAGESDHTVSCWNCDISITLHNGYGPNNFYVIVNGKRIRYTLIWQERP